MLWIEFTVMVLNWYGPVVVSKQKYVYKNWKKVKHNKNRVNWEKKKRGENAHSEPDIATKTKDNRRKSIKQNTFAPYMPAAAGTLVICFNSNCLINVQKLSRTCQIQRTTYICSKYSLILLVVFVFQNWCCSKK